LVNGWPDCQKGKRPSPVQRQEKGVWFTTRLTNHKTDLVAPAAAVPATAAAASTAAAAVAATATAAFLAGSSLVDGQRPPIEILAI